MYINTNDQLIQYSKRYFIYIGSKYHQLMIVYQKNVSQPSSCKTQMILGKQLYYKEMTLNVQIKKQMYRLVQM